jgi:hypothetical protein
MEETTITVRIPSNLKEYVEAACEVRGMTLTGFIRDVLREHAGPRARTYELPGFTQQFAQFREETKGKQILLLAIDSTGHRELFQGRVDENQSSPTLITLKGLGPRSTTPTIPVLSRDIVAWYSEQPGLINQLAQTLEKFGWRPAAGTGW